MEYSSMNTAYMQSSEPNLQHLVADARGRRRTRAEVRPDRKKRWTSKVKTGCATCRRRRIKCDEGKPVCRRCVFSKRQCGGYMDQPPPQYSSTANSSCCSPGSTPDPIPQPGSGMGVIYTEASALEQQMFYMFRTDTVLQVGCVFDMQFWFVDVPQAAQAHRPIWHASIALAALQSSRTALSNKAYAFSDAAMDGVTTFVMRHYHAAISALIPLSSPAGDTPTFETQQILLMTNVLLLGLASMQGNQRDAALFSRHSVGLFHDWRFWKRQDDWKTSSQGAMLSVAPLIALMYRLQGQEVADRFQRPDWLISDFAQFSRLPSATPFTSTTEAYRELQPMFAGLTTVAQEQQLRPYTNLLLPPPDSCLAFRYSFTAWRAKFDHLRDSQTPEQNNAVDTLILDLLRATGEHALYTGTDYSPLLPLHLHMVDTAERILMSIFTTNNMWNFPSGSAGDVSANASPHNSPQQWPSIPTPTSLPQSSGQRLGKPIPYSFGPVVLEPLFMVAINAADYSLRRRAIAIMRRWPRAEAIWSSVIMAAFSEALMTATDVIDGGLEVLENGLGKMQLRTAVDTRENWPGRIVLVSW